MVYRRNRSRPRDVPGVASFSRRRRFLSKAIDARGLRKSGDGKFAEIAPALGADGGKCFRGHHDARKSAGNLLQTRGEIDGRADAGEVETAGAADIAEQDAPDMQRHAEAEALGALTARIAHRIDIGSSFARRLEHARANLT